MDVYPPSAPVLEAFGASSDPMPLIGGRGHAFISDDIIFKPVFSKDEGDWIAHLLASVEEDGFRVERPVKAITGEWIYDNWYAFQKVSGKETHSRWDEKVPVSRKFHIALKNVPKPDFLYKRNHPWAIADKMIWGEIPMQTEKRVEKVIRPLMEKLLPITQPSQIIHGDMTGNILFSEFETPAVIDMSPYWRPAEYATAIIVVDSVVWDGAPLSFIEVMKDVPEGLQLLLRATVWRIKTKEEYMKYYNEGDLDEVHMYDKLIRELQKRTNAKA